MYQLFTSLIIMFGHEKIEISGLRFHFNSLLIDLFHDLQLFTRMVNTQICLPEVTICKVHKHWPILAVETIILKLKIL